MLLKIKDFFIGISNLTVYQDGSFSTDLQRRAKNVPYTFFLIFSALTAWGFYITNEIVCIDSLSGDRYSNGVLIGQNRLTSTIISKITGLGNPGCPDYYFGNFAGIVLFMLGIAMLCVVLERVHHSESIIPSVVFSCLYISFPLMLEWFTFGGLFTSGVCTVLIALALNMISCKTGIVKGLLIPSLLIAAVISYYEAFLLPFITLTALILILFTRYTDEKHPSVFKKGIKYLIPLFVGILLKINSGFIIQNIFGIPDNNNAEKASAWLFDGTWKTFCESVSIFFDSVLASWVAKAFCYVPITIVAVFVLLGIIVLIVQIVKTKKPILILLYGILYLSVFAFTIYRCKMMACRMEQAFPAFVASLSYIILLGLNKKKKKWLFRSATVLLTVMILIQCSNSSFWSHVENNRYTEEKQVAINIATDIRNDYDISKPVVFIGQYNFSDNIQKYITMREDSVSRKIYKSMIERQSRAIPDAQYKIPNTLVRSYLTWGATAFDDKEENTHATENIKFFNFIGCPLTPGSYTQHEEAAEKHSDIPGYPNKGYIYDAGDYLIVNLG